MNSLTAAVRRLRRRERGMSTAEYTVGTLGACVFAGLLMQLSHSGFYVDQLQEIFARALDPATLLKFVHGGVIPRILR